mmetsp:Transcript_5989/g.12267  ORF Transcript_5989/g.12267 Transcript_5989/m.12267 type:complete len:209 (-) Transcript_5989:826-1452(-)
MCRCGGGCPIIATAAAAAIGWVWPWACARARTCAWCSWCWVTCVFMFMFMFMATARCNNPGGGGGGDPLGRRIPIAMGGAKPPPLGRIPPIAMAPGKAGGRTAVLDEFRRFLADLLFPVVSLSLSSSLLLSPSSSCVFVFLPSVNADVTADASSKLSSESSSSICLARCKDALISSSLERTASASLVVVGGGIVVDVDVAAEDSVPSS